MPLSQQGTHSQHAAVQHLAEAHSCATQPIAAKTYTGHSSADNHLTQACSCAAQRIAADQAAGHSSTQLQGPCCSKPACMTMQNLAHRARVSLTQSQRSTVTCMGFHLYCQKNRPNPRNGKHALSTAEVAAQYNSPSSDLAGRQGPLQKAQLSAQHSTVGPMQARCTATVGLT